MPFASINEADIYYEVIGDRGPWVVAMSGGRHPLSEIEELTTAIAARGFRVIVHDRRNCGRSSLHFDASRSEEDLWADDLHGLLDRLRVRSAFVVGKSRTVRVAIRFAMRYPHQTRGLGLWGISGGAAAARFLEDYYYGKYIRLCQEQGMDAVCGLDHFAGLVAAKPENRDRLLAVDPSGFLAAMTCWRLLFLENLTMPVMGFTDDALGTVSVPTAIVPYCDRLHPRASALHALHAIPGARLFDVDPDRTDSLEITPDDVSRDSPIVAALLCDFASSLRWWRPEKFFASWRRMVGSAR